MEIVAPVPVSDQEAKQILSERAEKRASAEPKETFLGDKKPSEEPIDPAKKEPVKTPESKDDKKPEIKEPLKQEEPKPKKKLRDLKSEFFQTEEKKPEADKPSEDYKAKFEETSKWVEHPAVKIVIEGIKNKKNIFEILNEVKGVDASKMTDEQLYEYELKKSGTKPEAELGENSTETSLEEEMEKFRAMPKPSRDREIKSIKDALNSDAESRTKDFLNNVSSPSVDVAKLQERASAEAKELVSLAESSVGKTIYGITCTKEMAQKVVQTIAQNKLIPYREDGSIDTKEYYRRMYLVEYEDLILDTIEKNTEANTVEKMADEYEATPGSKTQSHRPPETVVKTQKGTEEYAGQVSKNLEPVSRY